MARLLDTAAPGTSLPTSRSALPLANPAGTFSGFAISGNGRVVVGSVFIYYGFKVQGQLAISGGLIRYSEPGGRASFLYRPADQGRAAPGDCQQPKWISPSGQQVLAVCGGAGAKKVSIQFVLLSQGHTTVLHQLARLARLAQGTELLAIGG